MRVEQVLTIFAILFAVVSARIDPKNLRCLGKLYIFSLIFMISDKTSKLKPILVFPVCRTTFEELDHEIKKIDKWKKVDVS